MVSKFVVVFLIIVCWYWYTSYFTEGKSDGGNSSSWKRSTDRAIGGNYEEDSSYWVEFPDLPGCQTYGNNLNQTVKYAQEALAGYLLTLLGEKQRIPLPSKIQELECDNGGFPTLISCDVNQYKDTRAVKKTLTIPAWLNDLAMERNINFSQILQEALLSKIQS